MTEVLIISDVCLYRVGLVEILKRDGQLEVLGAAACATEARGSYGDREPGIVLLDTSSREALSAAPELRRAFPSAKIIALGVSERRSEVIACAEAGIEGYVCREDSTEDLVETVRRTLAGELRCSRRIAGALMQRVSALATESAAGEMRLTPREGQVLELVDGGLTNKEIAARLGITPSTARNHVHNILEKLGAHTRGEAAAIARGAPGRAPDPLPGPSIQLR